MSVDEFIKLCDKRVLMSSEAIDYCRKTIELIMENTPKRAAELQEMLDRGLMYHNVFCKRVAEFKADESCRTNDNMMIINVLFQNFKNKINKEAENIANSPVE